MEVAIAEGVVTRITKVAAMVAEDMATLKETMVISPITAVELQAAAQDSIRWAVVAAVGAWVPKAAVEWAEVCTALKIMASKEVHVVVAVEPAAEASKAVLARVKDTRVRTMLVVKETLRITRQSCVSTSMLVRHAHTQTTVPMLMACTNFANPSQAKALTVAVRVVCTRTRPTSTSSHS